MGLAGHAYAHLMQTAVAQRDGGIAVKQKLVDGLTLFQSCQGTVLPQDRGYIGDGSKQTLMTAAQRAVAELQALLKNLPEAVHITFRRAGYIHQVDGDNTLIETSVELVASVCVSLGILHSQERTAAHTGIYVSAL